MSGSSENKKVTLGFLLSFVAGVFVLLNGIVWLTLISWLVSLFGAIFLVVPLTLVFLVLGIIAILFSIAIFIGLFLVYFYRNRSIGGKIVLVFSILSMGTGGGFLVGFVLGVLGGAFIIGKR
jgi:hypothetical protein